MGDMMEEWGPSDEQESRLGKSVAIVLGICAAVVLAVVLLSLLAGCKREPTQKVEPPKSSSYNTSNVVTIGSFCSPGGATGVTSDNKPVVCAKTEGDNRYRWREVA